ncbi:hypothetical protein B0T25DRAFT_155665 [Lasiosphaeria hispida]|uniref:Uncharacterized protein n=1 Tax=Lasiosphaeria hispida TaxID=260671 RepID=A0AAJ0MG30_9PEZI|nr:hypothetical protein B0T25DRAFT_155665 [Lasiosphaeria hispida]
MYLQSTTFMAHTFPVTVHEYPSTRADGHPMYAYEHEVSSLAPTRNALVFIGGLGDGPFGVPYARTIAKKAGLGTPGYSVFEVRLSSSFSGFGYGSLAKDVKEISAFVAYLRKTLDKDKIVLMGHSTGCQDCMEYADYEKYGNERVGGLILQGPVSDREALSPVVDAAVLKGYVEYAAARIAEGRGDEMMPKGRLPDTFKDSPLTAYRFHSLAAVGGDDDYFSSDLPDDKVAAFWGRLQQPVLIVPSGKDEYVPAPIDVGKLVDRWKSFCKPGIASDLSGLIPGANHRVDDGSAQEWLAGRVAGFLASI